MSKKDENVIVYYDPVGNDIWMGIFYTVDHRYYIIGSYDIAVELYLSRNRWIPDHFVIVGRLNE